MESRASTETSDEEAEAAVLAAEQAAAAAAAAASSSHFSSASQAGSHNQDQLMLGDDQNNASGPLFHHNNSQHAASAANNNINNNTSNVVGGQLQRDLSNGDLSNGGGQQQQQQQLHQNEFLALSQNHSSPAASLEASVSNHHRRRFTIKRTINEGAAVPASPGREGEAQMVEYQRINDYMLTMNIGQGEESQVFIAFQISDPTQVFAMKVIKKKRVLNRRLNTNNEEMIVDPKVRKEISIMMSMNSNRYVVKFYEALQSPNYIYLRMQLASFHLFDIDESTGECYSRIPDLFTERVAMKHFCQIADAVAAMNQIGLVHCDIKPTNILYLKTEKRALLADFGLATLSKDAGFKWRGTKSFMSPEVMLNDGTNNNYNNNNDDNGEGDNLNNDRPFSSRPPTPPGSGGKIGVKSVESFHYGQQHHQEHSGNFSEDEGHHHHEDGVVDNGSIHKPLSSDNDDDDNNNNIEQRRDSMLSFGSNPAAHNSNGIIPRHNSATADTLPPSMANYSFVQNPLLNQSGKSDNEHNSGNNNHTNNNNNIINATNDDDPSNDNNNKDSRNNTFRRRNTQQAKTPSNFHKRDSWALGIVLFCMIYKRHPLDFMNLEMSVTMPIEFPETGADGQPVSELCLRVMENLLFIDPSTRWSARRANQEVKEELRRQRGTSLSLGNNASFTFTSGSVLLSPTIGGGGQVQQQRMYYPTSQILATNNINNSSITSQNQQPASEGSGTHSPQQEMNGGFLSIDRRTSGNTTILLPPAAIAAPNAVRPVGVLSSPVTFNFTEEQRAQVTEQEMRAQQLQLLQQQAGSDQPLSTSNQNSPVIRPAGSTTDQNGLSNSLRRDSSGVTSNQSNNNNNNNNNNKTSIVASGKQQQQNTHGSPSPNHHHYHLVRRISTNNNNNTRRAESEISNHSFFLGSPTEAMLSNALANNNNFNMFNPDDVVFGSVEPTRYNAQTSLSELQQEYQHHRNSNNNNNQQKNNTTTTPAQSSSQTPKSTGVTLASSGQGGHFPEQKSSPSTSGTMKHVG
jgi:serine/threonine protein kinase